MQLPGESKVLLDHYAEDTPDTNPDTGMIALADLLAIHGIPTDAVQLRHDLGHGDFATAEDVLRAAMRQTGVRAKCVKNQRGRLSSHPLPALADGPEGWFIIGALSADGVVIQRPGQQIEQISREALDSLWSGNIIVLTVRESTLSNRSFGFNWFVPQIVRYRRLIGEVLLMTFALNLLGLAGPLLFQNVIDKVLSHHTMSTLTVLSVGFVAVSCWEVAFGWLRTRLFSETTQKIDVELGARIFRHLLSLPLSYFENRRVGDTVTRVRQIEPVREFLTNASLSVLVDPLFTLVFIAAMIVYSPTLFLIVLASLVAYTVISLLATGPLRRALEEKFNHGAANNALLVESVSAIQTVKAAAIEPQWQDRWERQLAAYSTASQRVINISNHGGQAVQLISKLSFAGILFLGAQSVITGTLTVGGLVAFNMFAQRVSEPVIRMAQLWTEFQQVRVAVERLGDVLDAPAELRSTSTTALPDIKGSIAFENVSFRYHNGGAPVVDQVSIAIAPGSMLGIVGSSGSGKSTLTKLLQRLYMPSSGRILVDDIDIAQIDPAQLRRQIGVVLQDNILFNRSVRDNIALAHPAMRQADVITAAKMAGAHDFILQLPQGYDTEVFERGENLSGGQRQRIAIARALALDPRILVLDEATSALDAESEEIVQTNLRDMASGRTVIIVAHRLSAVRQCDCIITMEAGRIVEWGTHEELLAANGRYAALYQRQMGTVEQRNAA